MIVIAATPLVLTPRALAGPAVLKASLNQQGIECTAIDFNVDIFTKVKNHPHRHKLEDFFFKQIIHDDVISDVSAMIMHCRDTILKLNPSIIALSLFCNECQVFTAWLAAALKEQSPHSCIVIGGPGVNPATSYVQTLKNLEFIDDFIAGDGDISMVEYVKGHRDYPGINSFDWQPVPDLNALPYPDYSDYNWYWYDEPSIPLIDSRGCVQSCEFCDVIETWKQFQYKTAENIFLEMMDQIAKYGIYHFDFRSSISNGNLKEFRRLIPMIADYNRDRFRSEQISWEGSFIIRNKTAHPESLWQAMSLTNATLFLGVESVVPRVRHGLGKNFENEDLDWHLEMGKKYNIKMVLLIITGYPTETLEDYEFSKQWFRDRKHYANNPVTRVQLNPANIMLGTELHRRADEYGIVNLERQIFWINQNLNIAPERRLQHQKDMQEICSRECNFVLEHAH
jgi:radical SAM superfamily enzyme YgiQ (UPF0313 family)